MEKSELKLAYSYFEKSYTRFKEALSVDGKTNSLYLDASIQRFEFTFEMCWKTKAFLSKPPAKFFKSLFASAG